jgi:hypothetical protein
MHYEFSLVMTESSYSIACLLTCPVLSVAVLVFRGLTCRPGRGVLADERGGFVHLAHSGRLQIPYFRAQSTAFARL